MAEIDASRALLREFDEWQHRHPLRIGLLVRWIRKFRKALAAEVERREALADAARDVYGDLARTRFLHKRGAYQLDDALDLESVQRLAALASQEKP